MYNEGDEGDKCSEGSENNLRSMINWVIGCAWYNCIGYRRRSLWWSEGTFLQSRRPLIRFAGSMCCKLPSSTTTTPTSASRPVQYILQAHIKTSLKQWIHVHAHGGVVSTCFLVADAMTSICAGDKDFVSLFGLEFLMKACELRPIRVLLRPLPAHRLSQHHLIMADILAIGNPLLDISATVTTEYLKKYVSSLFLCLDIY